MTTKVPSSFDGVPTTKKHSMGRLLSGVVLLAVGIYLLIIQFGWIELDLIYQLIPLGIGLIFALLGIFGRNLSFLIPGGLLTGIGLGTAIAGSMSDPLAIGRVYLLCFGLGCLLITILSAIFVRKMVWWPLIPGIVLAGLGATMFFDMPTWFDIFGRIWPVLLILGGIYLILRRPNNR